jgi:hypothetical protein
VPVEVLEDEEAAGTLAGPVLAEEGLGGLTPEDDAEGCRRRNLCLLHLLRLHLLLPLAWLGGTSGSSLLRMAAAAQRCSLGAGRSWRWLQRAALLPRAAKKKGRAWPGGEGEEAPGGEGEEAAAG